LLAAEKQRLGAAQPIWSPSPPVPAVARAITLRVILLLFGIGVPLVALECLLRLAGPVLPGEYQTAVLTAPSSTAVTRVNIPNRAGWKQSSEFRAHVRVNSHGLRGPEILTAPAAGAFRVLVLGDSFTFGAQVDEDETFVVRLGHYLRRNAARSGLEFGEIETINAGVDGWSTRDELAWLRAEGIRLQPDLVVLMFFAGNDPGENYDQARSAERAGGRGEPTEQSALTAARQRLVSHSAAYTLFETGVLRKLASETSAFDGQPEAAPRTRRSTDPARKQRGWAISGDLIGEMRSVCDQQGIDLLLVGIPTVEHVLDPERPPTPILRLGEAAGVPTIDLLTPFRGLAAGLKADLYFPRDRHWTRVGHDVAARHVAGQLVAGHLLSTSRSVR
jgi:hypothetical protein